MRGLYLLVGLYSFCLLGAKQMISNSMRDPELERLLIEAQKRYDALSPVQKKEMRAAQRKSYVIGEFMLDHPELSREYAEEIYEKVVLGIGL